MNQIFNFLAPSIMFGMNVADRLGETIGKFGATEALLVSDRGLEKAGVVAKVCNAIRQSGITVTPYTDIEPEPSVDCVRRCVAAARQVKCQLVVGMGGGSAMDVAKAVAMLLGNPGDVLDFMGQNRVPKKGLPTILMPTTAGTGSEVGRGALFYVPEHAAKESMFSPHLLTDIAMIDPMLTATCPPSVTAASGIDALCHAIESYTSRSATPLSKLLAESGIQIIAQNLSKAVANGNDLDAREGMALGSLYGSLSLANSTSHAVHAMAYPLQGHNRIVHGLANGVLLPHVMDVIISASPAQFGRVAELMGAPVNSLSELEAAKESIRLVRNISAQIGIPPSMKALGVREDQIAVFAEEAFNIRRLMDNSPLSLSKEDVLKIYQAALM